MKNARNKESRNRNARSAATAAERTGQSISDGGYLRTDDGKQSPVNGEIGQSGVGSLANYESTSELSNGHTRTEIETGYYCAPNGNVERIPDGYFVDAKDGRLKKRRRRRTGNNSDGRGESETGYGDRNEAGYGETEFSPQADLRKPLNVRNKRKKKETNSESRKLTMLTLIASGSSALFTSVALLTKHDHWALRTDCVPSESKILAEAINDALDTLPTKYYDFITAIVEKWIPWINLCFVVSALVIERAEQSRKLIEEARYVPREASHVRNAASGTQASNVGSTSSLGFGQ